MAIEFIPISHGRSGYPATMFTGEGEEIHLSGCLACGQVVFDQELHTKHHQTPVVG